MLKRHLKHYVISVVSQNPYPNEVEGELNNYASLGWTFKSAIPYLDGHMMLIFERED